MARTRAHRGKLAAAALVAVALVGCTGPKNPNVAAQLPTAWIAQLHDLHVSSIRCHYESRGCVVTSALEGTFDTDEIADTAIKPVYEIEVGSDALEVRGYFAEYGYSDADAAKAITQQLGPVIDTLDPVGEKRAEAHAFTTN